VAQLEARLEAAHTMVHSLSQANSATTSVLHETRQQHAAELDRLMRGQEALVSATAREASALQAQNHQDRIDELQQKLATMQQRASELEQELQVGHVYLWIPKFSLLLAP
jgi:predicted RNase H-like nuclease (RuvC/YqgF family)